MPEDYLLVLIRRAVQLVAATLSGRRDLSPDVQEQMLRDDFRLHCGLDLGAFSRRTPDEVLAFLEASGDALFADRGLILAAALARLAALQTPPASTVAALQSAAIVRELRSRFGDDPTNPLDASLRDISAALADTQAAAASYTRTHANST